MKIIREACVENFIEAKKMMDLGAERLELCENLAVGGTTPSYGTIKQCITRLSIPTFVMIRPRGGDFIYSKDEIEIMKEDIKLCKEIGVKGVVLGVLTKDKKIDFILLKELLALTYPMEVTFHKALDEVEDPLEALDMLIDLGVKRVLTSGRCSTAVEGKDLLNRMIEKAKDKISIVVAGKVTKDNLEYISKIIPNREYHGKKIII